MTTLTQLFGRLDASEQAIPIDELKHALETEGGVCGSYDMDIHRISDLQADGAPLVTLHVCSPPMGETGEHSLEDNTVRSTRHAVARPGGVVETTTATSTTTAVKEPT